MNPALQAACDLLVDRHRAVLVVAYGSFATETQTDTSDLDLVAWAPVESAFHQGGLVEGHQLDAWIYPLDHPYTDPALARVNPSVCLHDSSGCFPSLTAAVAETRRELLQPLTLEARADLAGWVNKMLVRAASGTAEGWQRYHWLLSDGPELWCQFRGHPWDGPQKALALMKAHEPATYAAYAAVASGAPSLAALAGWLEGVVG